MKKYLILMGISCFLMFSCSDDETVSDVENIVLNDTRSMIEANFLPTFTNYYGRDIGTLTFRSASLPVQWDHEYDDEGRLVKSVMYDKYPTRVLKEITFSEYSSNNLEVKITVDNYAYFLSTPKVYRYYYSMILNQDLSINTIINEEGISYSFDELNAQKWVTKLGYIIPDGAKLWTTNYDYDQNGNVILYTSTYYDRDSQDASVVYSYADSGNPGTYQFNNEEGNYSYVEYFYRVDNTLERMEESFNWGDGDKGKKIFIYTEEEAFLEQLTEFENGAKEIVDYDHLEGVIVEEHYGVEGGITNIYISLLNEDVYYLSTHEIYENGILVAKEFFNTENLLFKKEFYDPNGELEYTEYYDEDGNLTNTEYP